MPNPAEAANELLLSFVAGRMPDASSALLDACVSAVLSCLLDPELPPQTRRNDAEKILGPMQDDVFGRLLAVASAISSQKGAEAPDDLATREVGMVWDGDVAEKSELSDLEFSESEPAPAPAPRPAGAGAAPAEDAVAPDFQQAPALQFPEPTLLAADMFYIERVLKAQGIAPDKAPDVKRALEECERQKTELEAQGRLAREDETTLEAALEGALLRVLGEGAVELAVHLKKKCSDIVWALRLLFDPEAKAEMATPRLAALLRRLQQTVESNAIALNERIEPDAYLDESSDEAPSEPEAKRAPVAGPLPRPKQALRLPKGALRTLGKTFEEIYVPPRSTFVQEDLIPISSLPEWARPAFEGVTALNAVQTRVCPKILETGENTLVAAPTGAGKTNIAVLAILKALKDHRALSPEARSLVPFRCVYIAPMKSLIREIVEGFSRRFQAYGLAVRELSGDVRPSSAELLKTNIIVTTPEKWDVVTRRGMEREFAQGITLVIIDEIHLLHDTRGPVLEAVVARIHLLNEASSLGKTRLLALSATLPNFLDVARFIRAPDENVFFFGSEYKAVPCSLSFVGVTPKNALKSRDAMDEVCYEKIAKNAGDHQFIVFVHSRRETARIAQFIRDRIVQDGLSGRISSERMKGVRTDNTDLADLLPHGIGIHHAGLSRHDRDCVENNFRDKFLQVLVSTATLAWGVNLPAHTVIIRGTEVYSPDEGKWAQLSFLDVLQMVGRAGRPQYEDRGEGIVITKFDSMEFYLTVLTHQLPIESRLVAKLSETLNAQVALGEVTCVEDALEFLRETYLYVRLQKSPEVYGATQDDNVEEFLQGLARRTFGELASKSLISQDGAKIAPTELGTICASYYISPTTTQLFARELAKGSAHECDLLRILASAEEFKHMKARTEELSTLRAMIERVPVPIRDQLPDPRAKSCCLLQIFISSLPMKGHALVSDLSTVAQNAPRLARALLALALSSRRGEASVEVARLYSQARHGLWESRTPIRQLLKVPNSGFDIPEQILRTLDAVDMPLERVLTLNPDELRTLIRDEGAVNDVYNAYHTIPRLYMTFSTAFPLAHTLVMVTFMAQADFEYDRNIHRGSVRYTALLLSQDSLRVEGVEQFEITEFSKEVSVSFTVNVPRRKQTGGGDLPSHYIAKVFAEDFVGTEQSFPIQLVSTKRPELFPAPTRIQDRVPLALSALPDLFSEPITSAAIREVLRATQPFVDDSTNFLTPALSQTLPAALAHSSSQVLGPERVVASCFEFSLIQDLLASMRKGGVVAVAEPSERLAGVAFRSISALLRSAPISDVFAGALERQPNVSAVANPVAWWRSDGQRAQPDLPDLLVVSMEQLDLFSRKWRVKSGRHFLSLTSLHVCNIHMLGQDAGVIERVVARIKFVGSNLERSARNDPNSKGFLISRAIVRFFGEPIAPFQSLANWASVPDKASVCLHSKAAFGANGLEQQSVFFKRLELQTHEAARAYKARLAQRALAEGGSTVFVVENMSTALFVARRLFLLAPCEEMEEPLPRGADSFTMASFFLRHGSAVHDTGLPAAHNEAALRAFSEGKVRALFLCGDSVFCCTPREAGFPGACCVLDTTCYAPFDGRFSERPLSYFLRCRQFARRALTIVARPGRIPYLRRFLSTALPAESNLLASLPDVLLPEICTGIIMSYEEAVDWLTWTYLFYRVGKNPAFYGLADESQEGLAVFLSEAVEKAVKELEASGLVKLAEADDGDVQIEPLPLGRAAAARGASYTTVDTFSEAIAGGMGRKALLRIVANAPDFERFSFEPREYRAYRAARAELPFQPETDYERGTSLERVMAALQLFALRLGLEAAPFDRIRADMDEIVSAAFSLLTLCTEIACFHGHLRPAVASVELQQMLSQRWMPGAPTLALIPGASADAPAQLAAMLGEDADDLDIGMLAEAIAEGTVGLPRVLEAFPDAARAEAERFLRAVPLVQAAVSLRAEDGNAYAAGTHDEEEPAAAAPLIAGAKYSAAVTIRLDGPTAPNTASACGSPVPLSYETWVMLADDAGTVSGYALVPLVPGQPLRLTLPFLAATGARRLCGYVMCRHHAGTDSTLELPLVVRTK